VKRVTDFPFPRWCWLAKPGYGDKWTWQNWFDSLHVILWLARAAFYGYFCYHLAQGELEIEVLLNRLVKARMYLDELDEFVSRNVHLCRKETSTQYFAAWGESQREEEV